MVVVFVLVAVAVLSLLGVLHWYVWRRVVRDTTVSGSVARRVGRVVMAGLPLLTVATFVGENAGVPFGLVQVIAWPGYLWLAVFLYLLLALAAGELVRPLLRGKYGKLEKEVPRRVRVPELVTVPETDVPEPPVEDPGPVTAEDPSRRLFVSRVVAGTAAAVALGTVGYGTYGTLRGPKVKRLTVPLAKLPRGAHGFRIAVVSDVHLGPILGRDFAQRVVDTVNATQPDLIAVVGDLVDGNVDDLEPAVAPLAGLRARHGAFFVTGNHEYISGAEQWVEHVQELGLRLLANERVEVQGFDLAGVNDLHADEGEGPDFARALGDRDRTRAAVLLAHQPAAVHEAVRHGVDLQLSGHTHGGQLWPFNFVAGLANPTLAGLERHEDTQLYVTRGAGAWGPPVRVGAPSDITVIELASRQA
ncbi:metallophosphoesterase [Actinocorallia sp. B10E7]|uniref:metallophosphoesterase n=1 Tax=Actinocorallia sp. B10E7 TaxID=3153558 RepID=UPI00325F0D3C